MDRSKTQNRKNTSDSCTSCRKRLQFICDPLYSGNQKPIRLSEIKRNWHGDEYEERPLLSRLALHAYKIVFTHPTTNEQVTFVAPYPKDMDSTRKQLAKIYKVDPLENEE